MGCINSLEFLTESITAQTLVHTLLQGPRDINGQAASI